MPYLWLAWLPGEDYEPVQRWALWEIIPRYAAHALVIREKRDSGSSFTEEILLELEGPSPRESGHWKSEPTLPGGRRWMSNSIIDLRQWQIHREVNGGIPQLYWIIQGERGGHKRQLSTAERRLLRSQGLQPTVPLPGDLPYAPFDGRVMHKIRQRDKLHQWDERWGGARWENRTESMGEAAQVNRETQQTMKRQARWALLGWLEEQIAPAVDQMARLVSVSDLPDGDHHYDRDIDEVEQKFIESE